MTIPICSPKTVVPIHHSDRQTAENFAKQQPTHKQADKVYRNTLAVMITKHCLDILEIPSDLSECDSWNPFSRLVSDVADLHIIDLGRLECRPVRPGEEYCYVPTDVWEDRIGYVVVQIDSSCTEATLRGFSVSVNSEKLALSQLQPLEQLLIHLTPIKLMKTWVNNILDRLSNTWKEIGTLSGLIYEPVFTFPALQHIAFDTPERTEQIVEQLYASQWSGNLKSNKPSSFRGSVGSPNGKSQFGNPKVKDAFPPDFPAALVNLIQTTTNEEIRWKAAEALWTINPDHPATGVRRVLDLGLLIAEQHMALMVGVLPLQDQRVSILARLYPLGQQTRLLPGLKLVVLGADGSSGEVAARKSGDNYIQLKFTGKLGERFSINVCLNGDNFTEYFMI